MASSRFSAVRPLPAEAWVDDGLGCTEPRLFTRPLRDLSEPGASYGPSVISFAKSVLRIELDPWQKWLLLHALERRPDGGLRFRTVVLLVARQNGKTMLSQVLTLWCMYVLGWKLVLGTAQDLPTAEEVWDGALGLITERDEEDLPVRPELLDEHAGTDMRNGNRTIRLQSGSRYKVRAASRRAGRGLSGDLILLDELREHQNWLAWSAITKTTMARPDAMVWALSNAGDAMSVVLDHLRRLGHRALGDPDGLIALSSPVVADDGSVPPEMESDDSLGLFEWSAEPGCAVTDRQGWAQANPSRGIRIMDRTIASAVSTDPEGVLRTEVLCQWVESVGASAIDMDLWRTLADMDVERTLPVAYGVCTTVTTAPDTKWTSVCAAWHRPDGLPHVAVVEGRPGTLWVSARLAEVRASRPGSVVCNTAARGLVVDAVELTAEQQAQAHNAFADAVDDRAVWHRGEPELTLSVRQSCWVAQGKTRVLDRKGSADISPLIAAALAMHGLSSETESRPPGMAFGLS